MTNKLWNNIEEDTPYSKNEVLHQEHIFGQYKLYTEQTDKVSSRRNLTNVFFLSINSTVLVSIGFLFENIKLVNPKWLIVFPLIGVLIFCYAWKRIIKSYRQLNSAKFKVIGELEKKLPTNPFAEEWIYLGKGKDPKKYIPLSQLENFVPITFGFIYIVIGIYVITLM